VPRGATGPARGHSPSEPEITRETGEIGAAAAAEARESYVADVLDLVDRIPPGRVLTYGDLAALVGSGGPRQVGQVMSRWGSDVPWWRVLRADGRPAQGHEDRALRQYAAEGTPLRPDGQRVDLRRARWDGESAS
jgi:alkylated DNA nucleotide flippase Atl1